jgi:hypothetical protein
VSRFLDKEKSIDFEVAVDPSGDTCKNYLCGESIEMGPLAFIVAKVKNMSFATLTYKGRTHCLAWKNL